MDQWDDLAAILAVKRLCLAKFIELQVDLVRLYHLHGLLSRILDIGLATRWDRSIRLLRLKWWSVFYRWNHLKHVFSHAVAEFYVEPCLGLCNLDHLWCWWRGWTDDLAHWYGLLNWYPSYDLLWRYARAGNGSDNFLLFGDSLSRLILLQKRFRICGKATRWGSLLRLFKGVQWYKFDWASHLSSPIPAGGDRSTPKLLVIDTKRRLLFQLAPIAVIRL